AKNATDAFLIWEEAGGNFDCGVSDVVLPGGRGPEIVERFRMDRPQIAVVLVSGYTDRALGRVDLEVPETAFLPKPFEPKHLSAALSELINGSSRRHLEIVA